VRIAGNESNGFVRHRLDGKSKKASEKIASLNGRRNRSERTSSDEFPLHLLNDRRIVSDDLSGGVIDSLNGFVDVHVS